jgi:hypothetical protein
MFVLQILNKLKDYLNSLINGFEKPFNRLNRGNDSNLSFMISFKKFISRSESNLNNGRFLSIYKFK